MIQTSERDQRSAFSWWLRTGRFPPIRHTDGVEVKFNPWHDPTDGRFTFAGSGIQFGAGGADPVGRAGSSVFRSDNRAKPQIATPPKTVVPASNDRRGIARKPDDRAIAPQTKPISNRSLSDRPDPVAEFVGGVGEGLYDVAKGTVTSAYSALTTNPVATVRNVGRGIAGMIDTAIAAEDTPAGVQAAHAVDAITHAAAREAGHAIGSVIGNGALAVAPGAALSRVSALRRLRTARPRPTYDPPQIGWVKENLGRDSPAKRYNDSATGARPGQAPTLMRTMPDGSKRPVKFDGVEGEYLIDRKLVVVNAPRARAQLMRQSEVLAQHRLIGTWEVPNEAERIAGLKLLKKMNVTNIKVRVVKP